MLPKPLAVDPLSSMRAVVNPAGVSPKSVEATVAAHVEISEGSEDAVSDAFTLANGTELSVPRPPTDGEKDGSVLDVGTKSGV